MADLIYNSAKAFLLGDGSTTIDLEGDTLKLALVTSSYTPDKDAHEFFDDITGEVTGTGYTAGGATLTSQAVTKDTTNDKGNFDAADVSWSTATITARGAVLYKSTGTSSTSPLIAYFDFGADKSSTAGTFTVEWASAGILDLGDAA